MAIRTINHPDVEIREIDRSQATPAIVGTNVMICGHAQKGSPFEPLQVTSVSDWITTFGEPTNEAERYFYYGATEVLNRGGNVIASKLPYSNNKDANLNYIPLAFNDFVTDVELISGNADFIDASATILAASADISGYVVGDLGDVSSMALSAYDIVVSEGKITSDTGSLIPGFNMLDDFVIVDDSRGVMSGPEENGGRFIVIADYLDGLVNQRLLTSEATESNNLFNGVLLPPLASSYEDYPGGVIEGDTLTYYKQRHAARVNQDSTSKDLANKFPTIEFVNNGENLNTDLRNTITVFVCEQKPDPNFEGKLQVSIIEEFTGSLIKGDRNPSTGQTIYLPDLINSQSSQIRMYQVENGSGPVDAQMTAHVVRNGDPAKIIDFSIAESEPLINGEAMSNNIRKCLEKVSDINQVQIDILSDCGLSTIAQFTAGTSPQLFDPVNDFDPENTEIVSSTQTAIWRDVCDELITFCQNVRKDCMTIIDTPRNMEIIGDSKQIRKTAPDNTFSNTIANKLRYITGLNSSYAALYSNWRRALDGYSGLNIWMPPSISTAGIYVNNDRVANIWDAPAGLNRGVIQGISDLAFQPANADMDQLYTKSINYAKQFPLAGFILEGQKTTQVRPSAFDRVNVRRMFLRLERFTYQVSRYFVYEPNNTVTRSRLISSLDPIFADYKARGGIIDYRIVCDQSNNTPDVIDRNELKVAIFVKPTRTAEFILVDFIATRSDSNFDELI